MEGRAVAAGGFGVEGGLAGGAEAADGEVDQGGTSLVARAKTTVVPLTCSSARREVAASRMASAAISG